MPMSAKTPKANQQANNTDSMDQIRNSGQCEGFSDRKKILNLMKALNKIYYAIHCSIMTASYCGLLMPTSDASSYIPHL
jgi:hypothetical protein